LAKKTVSHSHTTINHANQVGLMIASAVLQVAPISTMNITGLRHRVRGLSLRRASGIDFHSIFGSSKPPCTRLAFAELAGRDCSAGSTVVALISEFLRREGQAPTWAGR
jgi:hypothetical protein